MQKYFCSYTGWRLIGFLVLIIFFVHYFKIWRKFAEYFLPTIQFVLNRDGEGWILSPTNDINPMETGTGLNLNISEKDNALNLDLVKEVAPYFRVSTKRADEIINQAKKSVGRWGKEAEQNGISKSERGVMENAFRLAD